MTLLRDDTTLWAEERLGVSFHDPALLRAALTHKSADVRDNYERLEFLGDRILGAIVAIDLYRRHPDEPEGVLTRRLHRLVSGRTCAAVARRLGVPDHVRLDSQARADGGADSDNILGDVMEALIGAVWLDRGGAEATAAVLRWWSSEGATGEGPPKHPKSRVQEWALARGRRTPAYELVARHGPHHAPRFVVRLMVGDLPPVEAEGASKQEAETLAAKRFLDTHHG